MRGNPIDKLIFVWLWLFLDAEAHAKIQGYFPTCYGPFSPEALDTQPYGPSNEEGHLLGWQSPKASIF